ncbi:hypothetical protein [Mediterraneibacter sp. ICN-202921]|uniref:hypothetical protein n=1 Tax=Mediterraneibacter sp. ICN-202921 TaxID=3134657 RepID=UPI0030C402DA
MMDIYYVNSKGVRLDLLKPPYCLQTGDIFDYEWGYESVDTSALAGRITDFTKGIAKKSLTLSILNYSKEAYYNAIDKFHEAVEYDVLNKTPGRLFVGKQYLQCYIISSQKTEWENDIELLDNNIEIVIEYPFWITEQKFEFKPSTGEQTGEYLDFDFDVPFDLLGDQKGVGNINYEHYSSCNFLMTIYGPCTTPRITIGSNVYEVKTKLDTGEYLQIDSRAGTVYRTRTNGLKVNEFDNRSTESGSIFEKIQPGYNLVSWDGSFGIDILIYKERSEPEWTG